MNPKSKHMLLSIFTFLIVFPFSLSHAFVMRNLPLSQLTGFSQSVFTGTVTKIEAGVEVAGKKAIRYTFEVNDCLKGACTGKTVSFNQLSTSEEVEIPTFKKEKTYTIFLARESENGFSNPVGLEQGMVDMAYEGNDLVIPVNARNRGFIGKLLKANPQTSITRSVENNNKSFVTLETLKEVVN